MGNSYFIDENYSGMAESIEKLLDEKVSTVTEMVAKIYKLSDLYGIAWETDDNCPFVMVNDGLDLVKHYMNFGDNQSFRVGLRNLHDIVRAMIAILDTEKNKNVHSILETTLAIIRQCKFDLHN